MSDLVFIYGSPAAGKYTIAKAFASELGWPLFHNHVVIDCVEALLTRGDAGFLDACADVRCALTQRALESGKSFVTTFVYGAGVDDAFVKRLVDIADDAGARFCAVQVRCSLATLHARCVEPHRAMMGKIATPSTLQSVLEKYECFEVILGVDLLVIDTDSSSVAQSVQTIRAHFAL